MYVHNYTKRNEADVESQVDMHTCADTYRHSNQDVGPDEGWQGHAHGATQR